MVPAFGRTREVVKKGGRQGRGNEGVVTDEPDCGFGGGKV